jgi:hypothetical protein
MPREKDPPAKKCLSWALWIGIFCLFLAAPLPAQKPWVRISIGMAHAAGIKETLEAPAEFQPYVALGDQRAFGWGEAIIMEFGVFITPRFSLSLGTGYSRHKLDGQKSPFPTKEYMDSEGATGREDFYTVVPGIELEIMPFFLNASYQIPLRGGLAANLLAGVTYYVGTLESKAEWDSYHMFLDRTYLTLCDLKTLGFHVGGGFDMTVSKHLALTLEGLYRIAVFEEFKDCQVQDSHFPIGDPDGDLFPEFAYTIEEISLTGISLQAGIKLLF